MLFPRVLLSVLLALSVSGCGEPAPQALTIVHFNDVYEIGPVEGGRVGGLARVATVIKDLRRVAALHREEDKRDDAIPNEAELPQ